MTMHDDTRGPAHRTVEIATALAIAAFGALVVAGSIKAGIGWGAEGPRAGFFPFYIGLALLIASLVNVWNARRDDNAVLFANWTQLRQVFSVLVPTSIYVGVMPFIGLYVSSFLFIAGFMRWLGNYRWLTVLAVSVGTPIITYIVFERWFLVSLPKGPLEDWLGL